MADFLFGGVLVLGTFAAIACTFAVAEAVWHALTWWLR